jgi:hypothetical protein
MGRCWLLSKDDVSAKRWVARNAGFLSADGAMLLLGFGVSRSVP